jgi:hypothetical protein
VNNLIRIMALNEEAMHKTIFSNVRNEAGINTIYDPESGGELYQVFIHNLLPYRELNSWLFKTFNEARSFAAKTFAQGWDVHAWDFTLRRKCGTSEDGSSCGTGGGCSSGNCGSGGGCGTSANSSSSGGGCSSCHIDNDD